MGTQWSVQIAERLSSAEADRLQQLIESELARINTLMSTYDPRSELSLFNASGSLEPQALHKDTLTVLDAALSVSTESQGAYDVTLQPVIALWGFSQRNVDDALPSQDEVTAAMRVVGSNKLIRQNNNVQKKLPDTQIDLSSIAKGYAVDQMGVLLEAADVKNYSAEIGGEIRTRGVNTSGKAWRIGLELPNGDVEQGLSVNNAHIASSGDYRHYREKDGQRYSHLIDGRTGYPIQHKLAAVTVLHDSTMLADAWSTALMVLGDVEGEQLARKHQLDAQLTIRVGDQFEILRLGKFASYLVER